MIPGSTFHDQLAREMKCRCCRPDKPFGSISRMEPDTPKDKLKRIKAYLLLVWSCGLPLLVNMYHNPKGPQNLATNHTHTYTHIHTKQHTHACMHTQVRSHYGSMGSLFRSKTPLSSQDRMHLDLVRANNCRLLYTSQSHFISMILINMNVLQKEVELSGEVGGGS